MKNRKRKFAVVFTLLLACLLLFGTICVSAEDEEVETSGACGENATWNYDNATGVLTISGSGAMGRYNQVPWAAHKKDIRKIVIQDGITSINDAFRNCWVEIVEIGSSVENISIMAFQGCRALTQIYFKGNAPTIGTFAFLDVTATVFYPASDSTWTEAKRQNYDGNLTWCPDAGNGAQVSDTHGDLEWEVKGNTLYIAPKDGVKPCYMNPQPAWLGYKGVIEKVVMSGEINEIGGGAFEGCSNLTDIQWPSGVTTLSTDAFKGCTSLETISIPDTVTYIGSTVFSGCRGLKSVELPKNVSQVEMSVFKGCTSLESITFTGPMPKFRGVVPVQSSAVAGGVVSVIPGSAGTFSEIDSAVKVYYPESADGWTTQNVQKLAGQYPKNEVAFVSYKLESDKPQEAEQMPAETTGTSDKEQLGQSKQDTSTDESQTSPKTENPEATNPESQQTPGDDSGEGDPAKKKSGTKWWIPVVIVVVVAAGATGAVLFIKKKKV